MAFFMASQGRVTVSDLRSIEVIGLWLEKENEPIGEFWVD